MFLSHGQRGGADDESHEPSRTQQRGGERRVPDVAQRPILAKEQCHHGDEGRVSDRHTKLASEGWISRGGVEKGTNPDIFFGAFHGKSSHPFFASLLIIFSSSYIKPLCA